MAAPRLRLHLACLAVAVGLTGCLRDADAPAVSEPRPPGTRVAASETPQDGEPAAPGPADPCTLLTDEEAERLAGTPLRAPVLARQTCTRTGPVTGPTAQVEVFVGDGAKKFLDIQRGLGHELRSVPGIGDECLADESVIFVRRGEVWASVRLVRLIDPARKAEPLVEAARAVATRI
ncbi:DUF3558 domain-containing protein [Micromonospora endolithica]|uniref:DUF3558 domain-containing protein n=1 Tax=Micromonospora endolithica TaxID=230091 RepID=A0A3A9ZTD6_9ACTN|nr:DUF3558 domain-containing protein [Micromonospora endolithica]RKN50876.1 DUF3558 domain-containing protein [Micromonospora endolithica]TWJ20355.1 hypothetical protein JD76_00453 [Micromonospora endolithica]